MHQTRKKHSKRVLFFILSGFVARTLIEHSTNALCAFVLGFVTLLRRFRVGSLARRSKFPYMFAARGLISSSRSGLYKEFVYLLAWQYTASGMHQTRKKHSKRVLFSFYRVLWPVHSSNTARMRFALLCLGSQHCSAVSRGDLVRRSKFPYLFAALG